MSELLTNASNQWCPGCGNFGILKSVEKVLGDLSREGFPMENIILVSGVGNHAKIVDYLNINSFNSLHGRGIPAAEAIRLANRDVKVICFAGDGDTLAEGLEHLIFAAKRNIDITVIVHDNRTYGLATGQFTPTSSQFFKGSTTPYGALEFPFNPLELVMVSGATFIGRGYPVKKQHFEKLLKEAILHKGFSFIDALQVCVTFNNLYEFYNENVQEVEPVDVADFEEALQVIKAWDYNSAGPIPIGKFFEVDKPSYEENFESLEPGKQDRDKKLMKIVEEYI